MSDTTENRPRGPNILIIGIGNPDRSDDAVGLAVARAVAAKNLPDTTVVELPGDAATLIHAWQGEDCCIIVDAVSSGAPPGAIHRFDAHKDRLPLGLFRCSSHSMGVPEAIELARSLNMLPLRLTIIGIEGKNFDPEIGLSCPVVEAARQVVAEIADEIHRLQPHHARTARRARAMA